MTAAVDRLTLLETLLRVVDAGSLSAAAKQLGTTQPTVSRRLETLERSLGVRLVARSTHARELTDAGVRYVTRARALLAEWEGFEASVRGAEDRPKGVLRVVVPHALGQERLTVPLAALMKQHPELEVEWILRDGPVRLVEERVDCLVRVGPVASEGLVARKIHAIPRVVVAAPALARVPGTGTTITRPKDLAALPWLALGTFYRTRVRLERGASHVVLPVRPRFVTDSLYALRTAALEGLGVAIASEWLVRDDLRAGRLVHLVPAWRAPSLPVSVVYARTPHVPAKVRVFVEAMRQAWATERD